MATLHFRKPAGYPVVFISGVTPEMLEVLDKGLSYSLKNAEYAQAALAERHARENQERKNKGEPLVEYPPWDGKVHFLKQSKKNGMWHFPVGLIERAKELLSWYDVAVDEVIKYDEAELSANFEWHGPEMRDYQMKALTVAIKKEGGVISIPTGGGKTLIALRLIYAMGLNTVILVHRTALFDQWCELIEKTFGMPRVEREYLGDKTAVKVYAPRICGTDQPDYAGAHIKIGMVQTLYAGIRNKKKEGEPSLSQRAANEVLNQRTDLLILDEAHHTPADMFYTVATHLDAKYRYGFSATVEREDGDEMKMEAALGPVIMKLDYEDLSKYLAVPVFEFIDVPATHVTGKTFPQVYRSGVVANIDRNNAIANRVKQLVDEGRQVYIHVEQIHHGEILSELMKVPFVYSKSKSREETIDTFKKGYTRALISTLLGEGVDIPSISAICMAGGRKTEAGTIQKIGRALRPDEKFKTAIIVDFVDKGRYLSDHAMARYQTYIKFYGEKLVHGGKKK